MAEKEEKKIKAVVTAIPEKGFCRCGFKFKRKPIEVEVSQADLLRLQAEKGRLVVEVLPEAEPKAEPKAEAKKEAKA